MPAYADIAVQLMFAVFPDAEIVEHDRPGPSDRDPRAGDDPWRILHLRPTAPPELVVAAHRCLAKLHHPDKGGSHEAMLAINRATEALKEGRS